MKRETNLFERITEFRNLIQACRKATSGKKDRISVAHFYFNLENEIIRLQEELRSGVYHPGHYNIFEIREPKVRKISSSEFRDRVVHHAICNYLEPIFEDRHIYDTYACRTGKGTHAALDRCQYFAGRYGYFLKCDIKKYFESMDHEILKGILRRLIKDQAVLKLLDQIIDHRVPGNIPGIGVPIGNLTSQHFANLYLGELDHYLKERLQIKGYLRYMDDFLCFSDDKAHLGEVLGKIEMFLTSRLNLKLKETATKIAPVSDGIPFLGLRIFKNLRRIQRPNLIRTRRKIHRRECAYKKGIISVEELVQSTNSLMAYISHGSTLALRRREIQKSLSLA